MTYFSSILWYIYVKQNASNRFEMMMHINVYSWTVNELFMNKHWSSPNGSRIFVNIKWDHQSSRNCNTLVHRSSWMVHRCSSKFMNGSWPTIVLFMKLNVPQGLSYSRIFIMVHYNVHEWFIIGPSWRENGQEWARRKVVVKHSINQLERKWPETVD